MTTPASLVSLDFNGMCEYALSQWQNAKRSLVIAENIFCFRRLSLTGSEGRRAGRGDWGSDLLLGELWKQTVVSVVPMRIRDLWSGSGDSRVSPMWICELRRLVVWASGSYSLRYIPVLCTYSCKYYLSNKVLIVLSRALPFFIPQFQKFVYLRYFWGG